MKLKSIIIVLFSFLLGSCCKEYSCTCYTNNELDKIRTAKIKKRDAKEWCNSLDTQQQEFYSGYCDLSKK